jgi:2-polyprenyl-3-methyl-5-hydroxy-6-metoxy-1,4-benzoquinol methylase
MCEVRRLRQGCPPGRILDVGCGDGVHFAALAEFGNVEGIEADATTLDPAGPWRQQIHVTPFQAPLSISGAYDLILFLDVIEHLDDPVAALALARSLLAPGGAVLVTVPALPWLWTSHDDLNHHRRRYTRSTLTADFSAAGFTVERMRFLFHVLVPAKLVVRLIERVRGSRPSPPRVPPEPLNALAGLVARAETFLLAPVSRVLPGTSLLAVGRST